MSLLEAVEAVSDRIPTKVISFGEDPFGNLYCFDYREGSSPKVVYWDHEKAFNDPENSLTYIADSFTGFVNMLYDFPN